MKHLTLLIAALFISVGAMAQAVYSSGCFTNSDGLQQAALYLNGERLHESVYNNSSSDALVCNPNTGDVYWAENVDNPDGTKFGNVLKNDSCYLENPSHSGSFINALYWDVREHSQSADACLYSVGYKTDGNGRKHAVAWRGGSNVDFWHPTWGTENPSEAFGITSYRRSQDETDGIVHLYCGFATDDTGLRQAVVWKNDQVLYALSANESIAYGIDYYDGNIYAVGIEKDATSQQYVATVWKNNSVLYRLTDSSNDAEAWKIQVVGGDVFVCGSNCIWKNGEALYSYPADARAFDATADGIYAAVGGEDNRGHIYKDGQLLYTPDGCEHLDGVCVYNPCGITEVRLVPYFEGFETGETEWQCWMVEDEGVNFAEGQDGECASYWHRSGMGGSNVSPATGSYCAGHGSNFMAQEGRLISPPIYIQPCDDRQMLSFMTYERFPEKMEYEGVFVRVLNHNGEMVSRDEVWFQTEADSSWKNVYLSMQEYLGEIICIEFLYLGSEGHEWYVDDVTLDEIWGHISTITHYPYLEEFEDDFLTTFHIVDMDYTGENVNWKLATVEGRHCLSHPRQDNGVIQECWAITRSFRLKQGRQYVLSFLHANEYPINFEENAVWFVVDSLDPKPSAFTDRINISTTVTSWQEETIDISQYAGHEYLYIAFVYKGHFHSWNIDDICITEIKPDYEITVRANDTLWGNVTGGGIYTEDEICTITATPNDGYEFLKWTKNNLVVSTRPTYNFKVTEDAAYTAVFGETAVANYTITTDVNPFGAGVVEGGGTYPEGTSVELVALPNGGYEFDCWNDGNSENPRNITVTEDQTYVASFKMMGVNDNEVAHLMSYPNPASSSIRIIGLKTANEVSIFNVYGVLVKTVGIDADGEIGIDGLASGMYVFRCGDVVGRFVKM